MEKFTGGDTMEFLVEINGRRNRTLSKLIETVMENGDISTPQILERINMKMGNLSVTTNQVSNWLPKSGCFYKSGTTMRKGIQSGSYEVAVWRVDFQGLYKKFGIDSPRGKVNSRGITSYRYHYLIDTQTKTMTPLHEIMKKGSWDEISKRMEANEDNTYSN